MGAADRDALSSLPRSVFRCGYQDADCPLSLREGLREYRAANFGEGFFEEGDLSPESVALFHNHDIVHVVFGLSTELRHEVLADSWTFFGVDIPWLDYANYLRQPDALKAVENIGWLRVSWIAILTLPAVARAFFRARKMTKPWPWSDHEAHLDVPLVELRREFGIEILE